MVHRANEPMLPRHLRRWPNIETAVGQCIVFAWETKYMCIESDILRELDFSGIISDFVIQKSRKVPIASLYCNCPPLLSC